MARPLRIDLSGTWYHVMNRGHRGGPLYLTDEDRRRFLGTLSELPERFGLEKCPRAPIVRHGAEASCVNYLDPSAFHIAGQAEHHRKATFQEEYRRLLEQYDIPFDERYVWD